MANAVATVSVTDERNTWVAGNKYFVVGTISISDNTYVTGGIACSFFVPLIKATLPPIFVQVYGFDAGATGTMYVYSYVPGADASKGLLKIFASGTATDGLDELSEETIPTSVLNDTITFLAIFNGMN